MMTQLRISIILLICMTFLTGVIYPVVVTVIAQSVFPHQANGSILTMDSKAVGSKLIGQSFSRPDYFWGRLSATAPFPYNAAASSGSNYGPMHPDLTKNAEARIASLKQHDTEVTTIPVDLVTTSASGLDSQISPAAAEVQVRRVASARKISEDEVRVLVRRHTAVRQFGLLGEPGVNVLQLNLALDRLARGE